MFITLCIFLFGGFVFWINHCSAPSNSSSNSFNTEDDTTTSTSLFEDTTSPFSDDISTTKCFYCGSEFCAGGYTCTSVANPLGMFNSSNDSSYSCSSINHLSCGCCGICTCCSISDNLICGCSGICTCCSSSSSLFDDDNNNSFSSHSIFDD